MLNNVEITNPVFDFSIDKSGSLSGSEDYLGIIGNRFLENFVVIIDYKNSILYLKPNNDGNNKFEDKYAQRFLGFSSIDNTYSSEGWIVSGLFENEKNQGLELGDIIIKVNKVSTTNILRKDFYKMFNRTVNELEIIRKNQRLNVEFRKKCSMMKIDNLCHSAFVDTIKILLYKEENEIFEKINFDEDEIFLDPLLFAYLNNKRDTSFSKETLLEIVQGHYIKEEPLLIDHSLNKDGIAYIPNLGYFDKQGNKSEDIFKIDNFEILKTIHPVLEKYFVEFYKGHIVNQNPSHKSVWKENYKELQHSIHIIKEHLPEFYKELLFANRKIYLHDNPKILNFATVETLGMLYFYVIGNSNLIYYIEELIHQGSHNFLYYVVHNRKDYFKIDVDNIIMRALTKQDWDYRSVYGAFHGLYTVTKRVECFDILLSKNVFSGKEKHELLGRLTDQFSRFRTGLELLNLDEIYTEKGKLFYNELDQKCQSILSKYKMLPSIFNLSNRDLDFRYEDFCTLNPITEFNEKDEQGIFKF
ncbi:MAG: hypothetical protein M0D53_05950 [Flavobacterium sp. JAD_PAG50586_2]|nr:MAG: hypothetical protein M0D53_05950 [Flavobacterium sp. JAD_PAG50586_2]